MPCDALAQADKPYPLAAAPPAHRKGRNEHIRAVHAYERIENEAEKLIHLLGAHADWVAILGIRHIFRHGKPNSSHGGTIRGLGRFGSCRRLGRFGRDGAAAARDDDRRKQENRNYQITNRVFCISHKYI